VTRRRRQRITWRVHGFAPESDGLPQLQLVIETDDPEQIVNVERAAHRNGIVLQREDVQGHKTEPKKP